MTAQQPQLSHPKYRPDIDGLRAAAVLAVVAFHAFPNWLRGGFIGVDVFFVISGYLISTIIFESLDKSAFSFSEFYSRRIRRIFPALLLVLIACFVFGWFVLLADEYKQLGKHIAAGAGFISNFILWNEAGYFDNSAETKPLLHLWSLGIEEQFYIVWPLFLWFAWKRKFNLLIITIVVAVVTFILNIKGVKQDIVATFYSPQTRFWELLSGSLLAWFTLYKKGASSNIKHKVDFWLSRIVYRKTQEVEGKTLSNALSFFGLLLLVYGFLQINKELSFPGWWALVPVLGALLIITAGSKAWVNRVILSNRVAVWFGLISFPLYLWHWPILSFARIVESEAPGRSIRVAAVVLSIVLAWLTYKLVECPLRFGKHGKAKVVVLVVVMTIIGFFGYILYQKNGFPERHAGVISPTPWIDIKCHGKERVNQYPDPLHECLGLKNNNKGGNIYLIGDSHAAQFTFPLKIVSTEIGGNFYFINAEGSNDIIGSMFKSGDIKNDRIVRHLLNVAGNGDFLVLTFHRGYLNDARDQHIDFGSEVGLSAAEKNFYVNFNSIKNNFITKGVRIILVKDGPLLNENVDVQLCLLKQYLIRYPKATCKLNFANDDYTRTRQSRVFERLAYENQGTVIVLDPLPSVYEGNDYFLPYDVKSKNYYMFDRHHLTELGSLLSLDFFRKKFLEITHSIEKTNLQ